MGYHLSFHLFEIFDHYLNALDNSIGVQLLANPSVIFMDEPSSGLDAFTSQALFETLKNLAMKGRTIIVSVHQPRSDIFNLIDNIVLLSRGDLVYSGPSSEAKNVTHLFEIKSFVLFCMLSILRLLGIMYLCIRILPIISSMYLLLTLEHPKVKNKQGQTSRNLSRYG